MPLQPGTLRVRLEFAKDIKDCDFFGRQDPYVRLRVGDQLRRSKVCKNGGTRPVWDETFEFVILHENTVDMELMDADKASRDDVIGRCAVSISKAREHGRDSVHAPVISGKKNEKLRGFVSLQLEFEPYTSNNRPAAAQPPPSFYPPALPTPPTPPMHGYPTRGAAPPHTPLMPPQQTAVWHQTAPGCTHSHMHPVQQHPLQPVACSHGYGYSYGPVPVRAAPSVPQATGNAYGLHPTWPIART